MLNVTDEKNVIQSNNSKTKYILKPGLFLSLTAKGTYFYVNKINPLPFSLFEWVYHDAICGIHEATLYIYKLNVWCDAFMFLQYLNI